MHTHSMESSDDLSKLAKNYALISLVESAKSTPGVSASKIKERKKSAIVARQKSSNLHKDLDELEE